MTDPGTINPLRQRWKEAIFRGWVWAIIGMLYGALFTLLQLSAGQWLPAAPMLVAGTLAGGVCALIYGSMRLTLIVASAIAVTCVLLFINADGGVSLMLLLALVLPLGAITGAIYGSLTRPTADYGDNVSRVFRADAKMLAGFTAGAVASLALVLLELATGWLPSAVAVALLVGATGFLYVTFAPVFIERFSGLLPPIGDGALAGATVAGFVAIMMLVLISGVEPRLAGPFAEAFSAFRAHFPEALAGGAVGGGLAGMAGALLLDEWQDL